MLLHERIRRTPLFDFIFRLLALYHILSSFHGRRRLIPFFLCCQGAVKDKFCVRRTVLPRPRQPHATSQSPRAQPPLAPFASDLLPLGKLRVEPHGKAIASRRHSRCAPSESARRKSLPKGPRVSCCPPLAPSLPVSRTPFLRQPHAPPRVAAPPSLLPRPPHAPPALAARPSMPVCPPLTAWPAHCHLN